MNHIYNLEARLLSWYIVVGTLYDIAEDTKDLLLASFHYNEASDFESEEEVIATGDLQKI